MQEDENHDTQRSETNLVLAASTPGAKLRELVALLQLAHNVMEKSKEESWIVKYGPEMAAADTWASNSLLTIDALIKLCDGFDQNTAAAQSELLETVLGQAQAALDDTLDNLGYRHEVACYIAQEACFYDPKWEVRDLAQMATPIYHAFSMVKLDWMDLFDEDEDGDEEDEDEVQN